MKPFFANVEQSHECVKQLQNNNIIRTMTDIHPIKIYPVHPLFVLPPVQRKQSTFVYPNILGDT